MRILAAVKLYELGRLSSGRAAELAGMASVEFLLALERCKVFPFENELQELEKQLSLNDRLQLISDLALQIRDSG
ncbi:MAG: UPF0175 family protein [Desulfobacterales bacterium]